MNVPVHIAERTLVGDRLTLGIRPDTACLAHGADAEPESFMVEGRVLTVEPDYGRRTEIVSIQHGSGAIDALLDLNPNILIGDTVRVHFPTQKIVYFGSDERRLN